MPLHFSKDRAAGIGFYSSLILIVAVFFWTRINSSDHLYFVGDGTVIVAMIHEMLSSGDWVADGGRITHTISIQKEWEAFPLDVLTPGKHYFNLSGYIVIATLVCKGVQLSGFETLSIPFVLHGFNVLLQGLTLLLLFFIGKHLAGRSLGLLNMLFFVMLPLAVTEAHYERPESWLAFLTAIILFSLLKYARAPVRSALAMGTALGLSIAVKFSQLFLGIIPAILFICLSWQQSTEIQSYKALPEKWFLKLITGIILLVTGMLLAIAANIPFVFDHLPDYFQEVSRLGRFYDTPHPLYSTQHYGYFSQLLHMIHYFQSTLGTAWCVLLLIGMCCCVVWPQCFARTPLYFRLSLLLPLWFILLFFSTKYNFFERIFSSVEPMLCTLSAIGAFSFIHFSKTRFNKNGQVLLALFFLLVAALWRPWQLNYRLVQYHIRQHNHPPRIDFQELLKKDFPGFWIKNVHITAEFLLTLPEVPEKAPRIYHIEDYNQYWTAPYLEKLRDNGFVQIATYCSSFHDLSVGNHTIYHAAAKNHYFVRREEWPGTIQTGYFRTNCK